DAPSWSAPPPTCASTPLARAPWERRRMQRRFGDLATARRPQGVRQGDAPPAGRCPAKALKGLTRLARRAGAANLARSFAAARAPGLVHLLFGKSGKLRVALDDGFAPGMA